MNFFLTNIKSTYSLSYVFPEFMVVLGILVFLLYGILSPNNYKLGDFYATRFRNIAWISSFYLFIVFLATWYNSSYGLAFEGSLFFNETTKYLKLIVISITIICALSSIEYLIKLKIDVIEYFIMLLLSVLAMMLLISSSNFLMLFLALEMLSLSLYVLACILRSNVISIEAGLKYFIMGSFSSVLFLFGISIVTGLHEDANFFEIQFNHNFAFFLENLSENIFNYRLYLISLVLIIIAFLFKLAIFPFHLWAPDVYEGIPTPIGLFFSTAVKFTFLVVFCKLLYCFDSIFWLLGPMLQGLAILSIIFGTLHAFRQDKIKRFFVFTSIAHLGNILLGISLGTKSSLTAALFYFILYLSLSLSGWLSLIYVNTIFTRNVITFQDLQFFNYNRVITFIMCFILFSMCGIPFLSGFFAKYKLLLILTKNKVSYLLLYFLYASTVVSCFYYIEAVKKVISTTSVRKNDLEFSKVNSINLYFICFILIGLALFNIFVWQYQYEILQFIKSFV